MIGFAGVGAGLLLITVGLWLLQSAMRCAEKSAIGSVPQLSNISAQQLPILSAAQLFEETGTISLITSIESKCGVSPEQFQRDVLCVLEAYAQFVQQLPASESHHHAQPGGLLIHSMEVADYALTFRRGQILPKGAAPEDILRLEHRWTYGIFVAALLHDIGKLIADLHVTLHGPELNVPELWTPLSGSMAECKGTHYSVDFSSRGERNYLLHAKLPVFLFQRIVPKDVLRWLSSDTTLLAELIGVLAGEKDCGSGEIKHLVLRADTESVKRNLLTGSRVRFSRATRVPLIERLMVALRGMLVEGGLLPLNRSGAAGWVHEGHVWFVSKRLADEVRKYLQLNESSDDGMPTDNQRLFDTWQEYGAVVSNPQTGGAIWNVVIEGEGYAHSLTVLRFPLSMLYRNSSAYPAEMKGRVVVVGRHAKENPDDAGLSQQRTDSSIDGVDRNGSSIQVTAMTKTLESSSRTNCEHAPDDKEEYLDDGEDVTENDRSSIGVEGAKSTAYKPQLRSPVAPAWPSPSSGVESGKEPPEAAVRFMSWLQTGLADGTLAFNQAGAMVHFVKEGMLLVSPKIFQHFANTFGDDGGGAASTPANNREFGLGVQKQLLKAGWHIRKEKGVNILSYRVLRGGKPGTSISGVVIANPERFVDPVPLPNPHIVRGEQFEDSGRQNGLSA